jgi:hypothetical protein
MLYHWVIYLYFSCKRQDLTALSRMALTHYPPVSLFSFGVARTTGVYHDSWLQTAGFLGQLSSMFAPRPRLKAARIPPSWWSFLCIHPDLSPQDCSSSSEGSESDAGLKTQDNETSQRLNSFKWAASLHMGYYYTSQHILPLMPCVSETIIATVEERKESFQANSHHSWLQGCVDLTVSHWTVSGFVH